ncbi:MAG: hypothetical protein A3F67_10920 [Verrucomicrobia bacterium RIFCSPHIGHO2_12_FULL_41_10]|nr:MAG: hypothetical protein A3F67_10920 [Verrucomicrobia bacterium RIFCSPHIGHO2_12_FULL_41_10]
MPFYTYKCTSCDSVLEVHQKITASLLTKCPKCEEDTLEKQLTYPASFQFKGVAFSSSSSRK